MHKFRILRYVSQSGGFKKWTQRGEKPKTDRGGGTRVIGRIKLGIKKKWRANALAVATSLEWHNVT